MTATRIDIMDAPLVIKRHDAMMMKLVDKAARAAAMKLKTYLVMRVDELGITDRGLYKNGLVVIGTSVHAEAPHSGVVELGARPHPVSREGIENIAGWARRKLGIQDPGEALSIAYAIAHKIEEEGQAPRYVMRDAMPQAKLFFEEEFKRLASKEHNG